MKNKKSIAMAMAAVSTMGAVAPVFAAEIVGTVVDNFNLDNLTSTDDKVRVCLCSSPTAAVTRWPLSPVDV